MMSISPGNTAVALRLRGLERRFGGLIAVRGIDFDVAIGERRVVLGPNGAGKTTLFNVISGEIPATAGTIEMFGTEVTHFSAQRRAKLGLARTFQISRLFPGLTVEDNLYLGALGVTERYLIPLRGLRTEHELRERAREIAHEIGLAGVLASAVRSLSHGQQRQLEVGLAQVSKPRLMLLDEPMAGLSPGERESLTALLFRLDPTITLLLIEHDIDIALRVASRVTVMHDGSVIAEGTPDEIRNNQIVQDIYLGSHLADA